MKHLIFALIAEGVFDFFVMCEIIPLLKRAFRRMWVVSFRIGGYIGCHQIPARSFFIGQYQFPVCARCSGVIIGEAAAIVSLVTSRFAPVGILLLFSLVMLLDWGLQFLNIVESTNMRRLISGIMGGFGCWSLLFLLLRLILEACHGVIRIAK